MEVEPSLEHYTQLIALWKNASSNELFAYLQIHYTKILKEIFSYYYWYIAIKDTACNTNKKNKNYNLKNYEKYINKINEKNKNKNNDNHIELNDVINNNNNNIAKELKDNDYDNNNNNKNNNNINNNMNHNKNYNISNKLFNLIYFENDKMVVTLNEKIINSQIANHGWYGFEDFDEGLYNFDKLFGMLKKKYENNLINNNNNNNNEINNSMNLNNNNNNNNNNINNTSSINLNNNNNNPKILVYMFMVQRFFRTHVQQRTRKEHHMFGGMLIKSIKKKTRYCQGYGFDTNKNKIDNNKNKEINKSDRMWKGWCESLIKMDHKIGDTLNYPTYLHFKQINKKININEKENGLCFPHLLIQFILFTKYLLTCPDYIEYFEKLCDNRGSKRRVDLTFGKNYRKFFKSTVEEYQTFVNDLWKRLLKLTPKQMEIEFEIINFNEIIEKNINNKKKKKRKYSEIENDNNNNKMAKEPPQKKRKK